MPYPTKTATAKVDIVSPKTISLSSGILEPLFTSSVSIIKVIQSSNYQLQKLTLSPVYYYDIPDPTRPLSRSLYIAGFCPLSSILNIDIGINTTTNTNTNINWDAFIPFPGMILSDLTVKRADKESLEAKQLDNSKKFTGLCTKLRQESKVAIIICPKTNNVGFIIPMQDDEDGYNYGARFYIGQKKIVQQMILSRTRPSNSNSNSNCTISKPSLSSLTARARQQPDNNNGSSKNSVAIIVPYRDIHATQQRRKHLEQFTPFMRKV